jgi:hypothetical protein
LIHKTLGSIDVIPISFMAISQETLSWVSLRHWKKPSSFVEKNFSKTWWKSSWWLYLEDDLRFTWHSSSRFFFMSQISFSTSSSSSPVNGGRTPFNL